MLFGGKKERQTEKLIKRHIEVVGSVVSDVNKTILDYCDDADLFDKRAQQVVEGESEADKIRREIERNLYDGAFMPIQRGDYSWMIDRVDKIANQCEAVAQFLLLTRPQLPDDTKKGLRQIAAATVRCYSFIPQMFEQFDNGKTVLEMADHVAEEEKNVDNMFDGLVRRLFELDIDLALKIHVKMLLDRTAAISNRIEDASDRFCVMVSIRP